MLRGVARDGGADSIRMMGLTLQVSHVPINRCQIQDAVAYGQTNDLTVQTQSRRFYRLQQI